MNTVFEIGLVEKAIGLVVVVEPCVGGVQVVCCGTDDDTYKQFACHAEAKTYVARLYLDGGVASVDDRLERSASDAHEEMRRQRHILQQALEEAGVPCPTEDGRCIIEIRAP